jgi:hypothetical protein
MYTISHNQGYNEPLDVELFESYEGEAKEIIFQSFIDEGMFTDTVYALDEVHEDDIELEVKDWLTPFEIEQLKTIGRYAPESFWDTLTVQSLSEALKMPTEAQEVA